MSTRRTYTVEGRLGRLVARGRGLRADIAEAVTKARLDLSSSQVSQLSLSISDPDLKLAASGLFEPSTPTRGGSQLDYGDLLLEVAAVEVSDTGSGIGLEVTARSLGAGKLKRARGALVRRNLSPTEFAALEAKAAGLRFVGEPSPKRSTITRQGGDQPESSWDTIGRLAKELGYIAFEAAGVLYFGRPTYLIAHTARVPLAWKGANSSPGIRAVPTCRKAPADGEQAATVDVDLLGDAGDNVFPGMALDLSGVPGFTGAYLITGVTFDLAEEAPVSVSAATPINPAPEPPESSSSGTAKVNTPKAGKYAGTALDATQLGNATTIYRAALKAGAGDRGAIVGIATALQESTLRNLKYGDRDSLGLFQQRAAWGPAADRTTPTKAAAMFYAGGKGGQPGLLDVKGWQGMAVGTAAQRVQRSAFPGAYAKWQPAAEAIVRAIKATATLGSTSTAAGTAAAFVSVALGQAGDRYVYGAEAKASDANPDAFDCSELVEWAAARVGVKFPDGTTAQLKAVKRVNVDQAKRIRGALLFGPGHVAISLGDGRTIEAVNRRYGVRTMSAGNRFTAAGLIPGLRY